MPLTSLPHRLVHDITLSLSAYLLCTLAYVELTDDPVRKLFPFAAHSFRLIASLELYRKKDNLSSLSGTLRLEEHTSELQSRGHLVCRLLLEKKKLNAPTSVARGQGRPKTA